MWCIVKSDGRYYISKMEDREEVSLFLEDEQNYFDVCPEGVAPTCGAEFQEIELSTLFIQSFIFQKPHPGLQVKTMDDLIELAGDVDCGALTAGGDRLDPARAFLAKNADGNPKTIMECEMLNLLKTLVE